MSDRKISVAGDEGIVPRERRQDQLVALVNELDREQLEDMLVTVRFPVMGVLEYYGHTSTCADSGPGTDIYSCNFTRLCGKLIHTALFFAAHYNS